MRSKVYILLQIFGVCLLVASHQMGWVELMRESDRTYIVEAIGLLTLFAVFVGPYSRKFLRWLSDFPPLLGMLGTVIGFILAFSGDVTAENMMDPEGFKTLVTQMLSGLGTALSTTLVGIISFIWLEVSRRCLPR